MSTTHTVQRGETLYGIARKFGTTVAELAEANHIRDPGSLPTGTVLRIPDQFDPATSGYTVKAGDTLYRIAQNHRTTVDVIQQLNGIKDPSKIKPGQILEVPAAAPAIPRASAARIDANGNVFATVNGQKKPIGKVEQGITANQAWVIGDGRYVAFSGGDGNGGFENEGQSLRLYDVETGKTSKVLAESFHINKVELVRTASGKQALIVRGSDGGAGGEHLAIVDPRRGQVFRAANTRVDGRKGDKLTVSPHNPDGGNAPPGASQILSLDELVSREVLGNSGR